MTIITLMTIVPIATQTSMYEYFGEEGCYFFWTVNNIYLAELAICGFGMAAFRLFCFHYLFKKEVNPKEVVRNILILEKAVEVALIAMLVGGVTLNGWEKAISYQFCRNFGPAQADVIHHYENREYNHTIVKLLRLGAVVIGQVVVIGELVIYLWILYHLYKHDKQKHEEGVITNDMVIERKQKNVITLYGQIASFVVEIVLSIYIIIHVSVTSITDPSIFPITNIVTFTIIALTQFFSSHEMKRFVQEMWNISLY